MPLCDNAAERRGDDVQRKVKLGADSGHDAHERLIGVAVDEPAERGVVDPRLPSCGLETHAARFDRGEQRATVGGLGRGRRPTAPSSRVPCR
jgi:hypothetical protein